jgi:hypothetical protein
VSTKEELLHDLALIDNEINKLIDELKVKIAIQLDIKRELAQHDTRA